MADHQLPAYIQNRAFSDFTDYASDGLGSAMPPHVSIQGNLFTLVDATGQEYQPMPTMDCVIVDRSNFACKMYYGGKAYVPGSDDPPVCWSTNGIGPSKEAAQPQARTCQECPNNVRGSATSKISGAAIKACRDEYHMAILPPSIPDMMFRYVLTPGSFENWQNYTAKFKNSNVRISMVVTRMGFQPKVNGVVTFESVSYVDEATNARVETALREKATDLLCGRLDTPKAITASPAQPQIASMITLPAGSTPEQVAKAFAGVRGATQQVQQPAPFEATASAAPFVPPSPAAAAPVATTSAVASPSDPAPAQRRRRRTAAEMAEAQPGPANGQAAPAAAQAAPQAPFPVPGQAAPAGNFGIAQGQPASSNPELSGMLDNFFKS